MFVTQNSDLICNNNANVKTNNTYKQIQRIYRSRLGDDELGIPNPGGMMEGIKKNLN